MDKEFNNDPKIIHTTIAQLKQKPEYKELLEEFDFLDYDTYPYSPLLGRTLNRLQESRLLSSINPGYEKYQMNEKTKAVIKTQVIDAKLSDQATKLEEMASILQKALQ